MRWVVGLIMWTSLASAAPSAELGAAIDLRAAKQILHGAGECPSVDCLLESAYRPDPKAARLALALWQESGDVAGVGPDEVMDGGFRGNIHLVPQLPIQGYRKHLSWVVDGARSTDAFFGALFADQLAPSYRWHALQFRFVRSLNKHRPSAYATGWTIEYNVEGSLNLNAKAVRETLFHELFHLNDAAHGEWSAEHLRHDYDAILAKCGPKPSVKCLTPYAPNDTMVRGGTFYAFQRNNGDTVQEYAAELAVRYLKEESQMLASGKLSGKAFKCGPAENARVWQGLVQEFFAGRDLVPPC